MKKTGEKRVRGSSGFCHEPKKEQETFRSRDGREEIGPYGRDQFTSSFRRRPPQLEKGEGEEDTGLENLQELSHRRGAQPELYPSCVVLCIKGLEGIPPM